LFDTARFCVLETACLSNCAYSHAAAGIDARSGTAPVNVGLAVGAAVVVKPVAMIVVVLRQTGTRCAHRHRKGHARDLVLSE